MVEGDDCGTLVVDDYGSGGVGSSAGGSGSVADRRGGG